SLVTVIVAAGLHGRWLDQAQKSSRTSDDSVAKRADDQEGNQGFPAGAQWRVSDSWASNLTAITAALGALVTLISDKLSGIFDAGAIPVFAITTALLLVVAALGPVAYTTLQERADKPVVHLRGTWPGVLVSTGITMFAVMGSLGAVGATAHHLQ